MFNVGIQTPLSQSSWVLFITIECNSSIATVPEGYSSDLALEPVTTGQACLEQQYHLDSRCVTNNVLPRTLPFVCKVHESGLISGKAQAGTACVTKGLDNRDRSKPFSGNFGQWCISSQWQVFGWLHVPFVYAIIYSHYCFLPPRFFI